MASARTPSANDPAKDLILVHIVQLKPMVKAQISGRDAIRNHKRVMLHCIMVTLPI